MMKREDLDRAFGATPTVFTDRIDHTLRALEEEKPVKKFTFRTVLAAAMITLLLCGIAYAVIYQGQEWYYANRFTALKEHEPDTYQAIMDNLTTDVPQDVAPDTAGLISAVVQDYAWVDERGIFTVSMAARPVNDKTYEIYPIWNLDPDGACADELDPNDPEIRTEHWLQTEKGFGLPKDVMNDPTKQLLLVDFGDALYIGDTETTLPGRSFDAFTGGDGAAIFVFKYDISKIDTESINPQDALTTVRPGDTGLAVQRIQQRLSDLGYYNGYVNGELYDDEVVLCLKNFQAKNGLVKDGVAGAETQAKLFSDEAVPVMDGWEMPVASDRSPQETIADMIKKNTDADGNLSLRMSYRVMPFENGEIGEATEGTATFTVKVK